MDSGTLPTSEFISDYVVDQCNGVKGLVENMGVEILPDQYVQPPSQRLDPTGDKVVPENSVAIPVIDVSDWTDPGVMESICEAASAFGFFQIVNHGIPVEVLEGVRDAGQRFFEQPVEEKRKFCKKNNGYDAVELNTGFMANRKAKQEWRDFLRLTYVRGDEATGDQWPLVCRNEMLDYIKRVEPVIKKLLETLLQKLNVKVLDSKKESEMMERLITVINYYPKCPNPELAAGTVPHSDGSTFTLLLQDDVGGLYVRSSNDEDEGRWIHVPPMKGALVINIGDVLQIISNDRYRSVEHFVIPNGSRDRISIPVFVNPAHHVCIKPLPEAMDKDEKPLYRETLYGDYLSYILNNGPDRKKTIEICRASI